MRFLNFLGMTLLKIFTVILAIPAVVLFCLFWAGVFIGSRLLNLVLGFMPECGFVHEKASPPQK